MSTIHGASWEAIAAFRENPAALAVYWIYCARVNRDNVAWPSLRGLSKYTGWSVSACQNARKWLVAHGALEQVPDYIRPQWRSMPEERRTELKNLDRAEYYRPTGYIEFADAKRIDLLYVPGKDAVSDIDAGVDVLPGTTSDAIEHRPRSTELDSSKELDSTLCAPGGVPKPARMKASRPRDLLFDAIAETWQTTAGAFIGKIKRQMTGRIPPSHRDFAANFDVPPSPEEVRAFGVWFRQVCPGCDLPVAPETLQRRFYEFRKTQAKIQTQPADDGRLYVTGDGRRLSLAQYLAEVSTPEDSR